mmetsp:Transcript_72002/g.126877  ORF Transcript_72002/g.126877 Transcript_72002/m.126877 type:complete len:256 (+) Transcript_72002:267-1034(+)
MDPLARSRRLWNIWNVSELGWCTVATTVRPCPASSRSVATTDSALKLSSPEVGSSRNSVEGCDRSSTAMATRFRSPPDTPRTTALPIRVWATRVKPSSRRTASTLASCSCGVCRDSRRRAANMQCSRTVRLAIKTSSCMTYAMRRLMSPIWSKGTPSKKMLPSVGTIRPAMTLRRVVFPAPLDPMMARSLLGRTCAVTLERICFHSLGSFLQGGQGFCLPSSSGALTPNPMFSRHKGLPCMPHSPSGAAPPGRSP